MGKKYLKLHDGTRKEDVKQRLIDAEDTTSYGLAIGAAGYAVALTAGIIDARNGASFLQDGFIRGAAIVAAGGFALAGYGFKKTRCINRDVVTDSAELELRTEVVFNSLTSEQHLMVEGISLEGKLAEGGNENGEG